MTRGNGTGPRGQGPGQGVWVKEMVSARMVVVVVGMVLQQTREVIVSTPKVVKEQLIN